MLGTINPEILFLQQEDQIKAGLLDMKMILKITEDTYKMLGQGQIQNPPKVHLGIPEGTEWESFFNTMPSYIGGDLNIAGRDDVRRRILVREICDGAVCGRGQADDEQRAGKQLLFHRSFPFLYVFFYSFYVRMPLFGRAYMDTPSASEYPYIPCLPAGKQSMEREK